VDVSFPHTNQKSGMGCEMLMKGSYSIPQLKFKSKTIIVFAGFPVPVLRLATPQYFSIVRVHEFPQEIKFLYKKKI
jgi:hypothetical protein